MPPSARADLLIAAPSRWDEACFSVPAVRAVAASGLSVSVLCPGWQAAFWETLQGIGVISYPARAKAAVIAGQIGDGWQASLVWEPGAAADAFARLGIERRLGPQVKPLTRRLTHPICPLIAPGPLDHRVRYYLTLIGTLGIDVAKPEFFAPAMMGIVAEPGTVLICPDSDFGISHEWPLDRWLALAAELEGSGMKITTAGLPNGRRLGSKLADRLGVDAVFFSASPLAAALPIFAVHQAVIAADGSLPHLAAHAGSTCITLFGPNDPAWKRPLGRKHRVIRHHVECAPCLLPKCPLNRRCQMELALSEVLAAIRPQR